MNGYEATKAALYAAGLSSTEKLVLIALADHVNEAGECWPSQPRLAQITGLKERAVRGALSRLAQLGVIKRKNHRGQNTHYDLSPLMQYPGITFLSTPAADAGVEDSTPALNALVPRHVMPMTPALNAAEQTNNKPSEQKPEPAAAALPETDPEVGAVFAAYQDNIGSLTAHISERIGEAIDEHTTAWVLAAIKLAVERNKRSWKYIEGILKSWQAQGHMDYPQAPAQANGNGEAAWQLVMSQIKAGVWTAPKDGPELAAIKRSGGWPRYKESLDRDLPFLKREFLQEYHHGGH